MATNSDPSQGSTKPLAPVLVGLAIFLFFPLGLYLLWRHPTLGKNAKWWASGIAWAFLVLLSSGKADKNESGRPENKETTSPETSKQTGRQDKKKTTTPVTEKPDSTSENEATASKAIEPPKQAKIEPLRRGWLEAQHEFMRRVAEATLPEVYGGYEMKWSEKFLAGKDPSKYGWGGTAKLRDGRSLWVSFFPKGSDFVWLSSPSDGGIFAAGYSDTRYWDSKGEPIEDDTVFWKRAGFTMEEVMKESTQMAKVNRANEERRRQENITRGMDGLKGSSPRR